MEVRIEPLLRKNLGPRYVQSFRGVMDATAVFETYSGMMPKSETGAILNLECGCGKMTNHLLRKFYGPNRIIGIDKYADMINYASTFYGNVEYAAMDITNDRHVSILKDDTSFENIFCFTGLHWIHKHQQTLSNIYFLLEYKGRCLLSFVAESPVYDTYKNLAENPKWTPYMLNYADYIPFTHRTAQHDISLILAMSTAEIRVRKTQSFLRNCRNRDELKDHVCAINPFISRIPKIHQWAFVEDCVQEIVNAQQKFEYVVVSALGEKTKLP